MHDFVVTLMFVGCIVVPSLIAIWIGRAVEEFGRMYILLPSVVDEPRLVHDIH